MTTAEQSAYSFLHPTIAAWHTDAGAFLVKRTKRAGGGGGGRRKAPVVQGEDGPEGEAGPEGEGGPEGEDGPEGADDHDEQPGNNNDNNDEGNTSGDGSDSGTHKSTYRHSQRTHLPHTQKGNLRIPLHSQCPG